MKFTHKMKNFKLFEFFLLCALFLLRVHKINCGALELNSDNWHDTLKNNKIVLINFYAEWCMFSAQLAPIFHQAADLIHEEYNNVKLARLNCEREVGLAMENQIGKYPTIKLFRNGRPVKKEYRGSRSVNAFVAFIKQQMRAPVTDVLAPEDLKINEDRNTFIGYFTAKDDDAYKIFQQLAEEVFETTESIACLGVEGFANELANGENVVYKSKKGMGEAPQSYTGDLTDLGALRTWLGEKANPLVREITFDNGEELTEEGLPFLLLFYKPGDTESLRRYRAAIERELLHERHNVNFITADGTTFSSPLKHIGKTVADMPIICLDSFRHMYLFKRFSDVDVPGKLRRFIEDLHSGRLHFEFHNPPAEGIEEVVQEIPIENTISSTSPPETEKIVPENISEEKVDAEVTTETHKEEIKPPPAKDDKGDDNDGDDDDEDDENTLDAKQESGSGKVSPPETVFWKLGPSESRYTLLHWRDYAGNFRDEL